MGRPLKCPKCGASEGTLLQDNIYQCKFCGSIYEYGEVEAPRTVPSPVIDQQQVAKVASKIIRAIFTGIVLLFIGIAVAVYFSTRHNILSVSGSKKSLYENSNESNSSFTVVNATSGPQVWTLSRRNADGLTDVSYFINLVDPVERKVLKTIQLGNTITWKQSFEDAYRVGALKPIGSYCFVSVGDSLFGFDVNTFALVINNTTLQYKFPELKNGIAKIEDVHNLEGFKFTTKDGYIYFFLPEQNKLITEKQYDSGDQFDPETTMITDYGFSGGERPQFYKLTRKIGKVFTRPLSSSVIDDLLHEEDGWNRRVYNVSSIEEVTPGIIYFKGNVLYGDSDQVVVAYQTEAGDQAPVNIRCFNADKQIRWENRSDSAEVVRPMLGASNTTGFLHGDELIVIQPYQVAVNINVKDGSVLWSFKPY